MKLLPIARPAADALDIVFAQRNKAYGAYQLRRDYPNYIARALGIAFVLICFFLASAHVLYTESRKKKAEIDGTVTICNMTFPELTDPKPLPPKLPMAPQAPLAPPMKVFVPPVVLPDNFKSEQAPAHTVLELIESAGKIGPVERDGSLEDVPPSAVDLTGAGNGVEFPVQKEDDALYDPTGVQKMPGFPGGEKELLAYLSRNLRYPDLARQNGIEGQVVLSFVVNKDGSIGDAQVIKSIGGGCAKEALRVVQSMPTWIPGEANGHAVKVRFFLPVIFKLQ